MCNVRSLEKECPICGRKYIGHSVRLDNIIVCPECGQRQALKSIGVYERDAQDHIIKVSKGGR